MQSIIKMWIWDLLVNSSATDSAIWYQFSLCKWYLTDTSCTSQTACSCLLLLMDFPVLSIDWVISRWLLLHDSQGFFWVLITMEQYADKRWAKCCFVQGAKQPILLHAFVSATFTTIDCKTENPKVSWPCKPLLLRWVDWQLLLTMHLLFLCPDKLIRMLSLRKVWGSVYLRVVCAPNTITLLWHSSVCS